MIEFDAESRVSGNPTDYLFRSQEFVGTFRSLWSETSVPKKVVAGSQAYLYLKLTVDYSKEDLTYSGVPVEQDTSLSTNILQLLFENGSLETIVIKNIRELSI